MRQQIKVNGIWIDGVPSVNEWYRQQVSALSNGEPVWQEQRNVEVVEPVEADVFTTANESVKINGNPAVGFQSVYFGVTGDSVNMSFDIVDGNGALQAQLDSTALGYPPILALPVLKVVNGNDASIVDEVYFSTTLVAGVITVTGSFPASGNWKLLAARINAALSEIGATWILSKADATFRINS